MALSPTVGRPGIPLMPAAPQHNQISLCMFWIITGTCEYFPAIGSCDSPAASQQDNEATDTLAETGESNACILEYDSYIYASRLMFVPGWSNEFHSNALVAPLQYWHCYRAACRLLRTASRASSWAPRTFRVPQIRQGTHHASIGAAECNRISQI